LRFNVLYVLALFVLSQACSSEEKEPVLRIAAAANMQFAMAELVDSLQAATQIPCQLIISSSGKLTAQIKAGGPFDVFLSADLKYPQEIERAGLALYPPEVYAYGRLVLWSAKAKSTPSLDQLQDPNLRHLALANPQTAPYGRAAQEYLEQAGLWEDLQSKFVFGESIAQTNQFIVSQAAELGFTAMSVVTAPSQAQRGRWIEVPDSTYSPIAQGIVLLQTEKAPQAARDFLTFILSSQGQTILESFGYRRRQ